MTEKELLNKAKERLAKGLPVHGYAFDLLMNEALREMAEAEKASKKKKEA